MNGVPSGWVWVSIVTWRSSMHLPSADCGLGEARLISSPSTMLAQYRRQAGNPKSRCSWLKTSPPYSVGSRCGVNCRRRNESRSNALGIDLGQHGLADTGACPPIRRCPSVESGRRGPAESHRACPDDLLDVGLDLPELGREPLPVLGTLANLHPITPSRATGPRGPDDPCANDPVIVRHIHVSETLQSPSPAAEQGCRGGGGKFPQPRRPSEPWRHEVRAAVRPSTRTPLRGPI